VEYTCISRGDKHAGTSIADIWIYVYTYICIYLYMYIHVHICIYIYINFKYTYTYMWMYAYAVMSLVRSGDCVTNDKYVYIWIYIHIHMYIQIHTHIHKYKYNTDTWWFPSWDRATVWQTRPMTQNTRPFPSALLGCRQKTKMSAVYSSSFLLFSTAELRFSIFVFKGCCYGLEKQWERYLCTRKKPINDLMSGAFEY